MAKKRSWSALPSTLIAYPCHISCPLYFSTHVNNLLQMPLSKFLQLWGWVIGFSFYHKPHASNCGQITYCFGREDGAGNVLKCFYGFCSVVNLFYANNVFNIINICHGKHGRIITRTLGKVRMLLRVNIADSTTTKACLVTDLRFRKIRIKQCNNIKGFGRNQLLLGGMWWFMMLYILVSIIYVVELNISHVDLLMQAWWSTKLYS